MQDPVGGDAPVCEGNRGCWANLQKKGQDAGGDDDGDGGGDDGGDGDAGGDDGGDAGGDGDGNGDGEKMTLQSPGSSSDLQLGKTSPARFINPKIFSR